MRITPKEIAQRLAQDAERFCHSLFPAGKRQGPEFCVGSIAGDAGDSLRIHVGGDKSGLWKDFADSDRGGDLLDLLAKVRGTNIGGAIKEAKDFLGIRDGLLRSGEAKSYRKPSRPIGMRVPIKEADAVRQWLMEHRKFTEQTIKDFHIGALGHWVIIPLFGPDGKELANIKKASIYLNAHGKRDYRWADTGCAPSLIGWQCLKAEAREVIICEGQWDAMTWHQMGFEALSVPSGTGDMTWIEYEWESLERFDTIILNFDNDTAGQKAAEQAAKRLGQHRCPNLALKKHKDANEMLQAGGTEHDFVRALGMAKPFAPKQIRTPLSFVDDLDELFEPASGIEPGFKAPLFYYQVLFRPGELTIWTGYSGHGKSMLISQFLLQAMAFEQRCAVASMEMAGKETLRRMAIQVLRDKHPGKQKRDQFWDWLNGRMWIFDVMGNVEPVLLFELMEYAAARYAIHHFLIDSLMKCNVPSDDYEGHRKFADQLATFARNTNSHVHLVAHSKKAKDESAMAGKLDIKGGSDLSNQADNCMVVWRKKKKPGDKSGAPDAVVACEKQRFLGWEGGINLWYDTDAFVFEHLDKKTGQVKKEFLGPEELWPIDTQPSNITPIPTENAE